MYKKILVPIALDHERDVTQAIAVARALKDAEGAITLLHVTEELPGYVTTHIPEGTEDRNHAAALSELKALAGSASDINVKVVSGHASRTILDESAAYDCVVVASHRPGLQDYFLGSTAARVAHHANCAVHVVR